MKSRSVGTKFTIDGVEVGSLTSIGGVEATSETVDVTDLGNADGYKEFVGGFKDGGEVALDGYMDGDNEGQEKMSEAFEDQELHDCAIIFPKAIGKAWNFKGIVTKYHAGGAEVSGALKFASSVKISGKPKLATSTDAAAQTTGQNQEG